MDWYNTKVRLYLSTLSILSSIPAGSITYLDFPTRSYLVSASEDGTICLFRTRDWFLLRTLKGHKGRVNNFAIHPSGKLALSVGKDRALRMWDLIRGKGSASTKLGKGQSNLIGLPYYVETDDNFIQRVRWSVGQQRELDSRSPLSQL